MFLAVLLQFGTCPRDLKTVILPFTLVYTVTRKQIFKYTTPERPWNQSRGPRLGYGFGEGKSTLKPPLFTPHKIDEKNYPIFRKAFYVFQRPGTSGLVDLPLGRVEVPLLWV